MSFNNPTSTISAILTNAGRQALARSTVGELSFVMDSFSVGQGGYDAVTPDPTQIIPVDPNLNTLILQIFPTSPLTQPLQEAYILGTQTTAVAWCRLDQTQANYGLGEIGLWAKILKSNIPSEVGTTFLFAVAHMPFQGKTNSHVYVFNFVIQF